MIKPVAGKSSILLGCTETSFHKLLFADLMLAIDVTLILLLTKYAKPASVLSIDTLPEFVTVFGKSIAVGPKVSIAKPVIVGEGC